MSLFSKLGDLIGRGVSLDLPHAAATVGEPRQVLVYVYQVAASVSACVSDLVVEDGRHLVSGDGVPLLPPVSAG